MTYDPTDSDADGVVEADVNNSSVQTDQLDFGDDLIEIGQSNNNASASGTDSMAIGANASAAGQQDISIGKDSVANSDVGSSEQGCIAIGRGPKRANWPV